MALLDPVKTVIIVMMENRSFDQMLGYLSLINPTMKVDGLVASSGTNTDYRLPLAKLTNGSYLNVSSADGEFHYPFHMADNPLTTDVPHDRHSVEQQLAKQPNGTYSMSGFADAYYNFTPTRMQLLDPMGFFTPAEVPTVDFFARHFAVFDRWFCPIPTDTQPNRLMALNGETKTDRTAGMPPNQELVLDWLNRNKITWRIYSDDISFFVLFKRWWLEILTSDRFRKFSTLARDVIKADPKDPTSFPQVIIVEPSYLDSPLHPDHEPNDDHPPLQVGFGEDFLRQVYQALTPLQNLTVWQNMVMIVSFDEHGGFYDHVPPLSPVNQNCGDGNAPFTSTGPRVPAFIVSPFVGEGQTYSKNLDHTSVLEFLADWLTPGTEYSPLVTTRLAQQGFTIGNGRGRLSDVLALLTVPRTLPPNEPVLAMGGVRAVTGRKVARTPNELVFEQALRGMIEDYPEQVGNKYPQLLHWRYNMT